MFSKSVFSNFLTSRGLTLSTPEIQTFSVYHLLAHICYMWASRSVRGVSRVRRIATAGPSRGR
jgi:hypothetical protein